MNVSSPTIPVITDAITALCFWVISASTIYVVWKKGDTFDGTSARTRVLSALLFVIYGLDHIADIYALEHPNFWLTGTIRISAAVGSILMVIAIPFIARRIFEYMKQAAISEDRRVKLHAAVHSNQMKNDFMATMSHELRTPLTALAGYAELMRDEIAGPLNDQQKDFLDRMQASSKHLEAIISDILDIAKIESGTLDVVREKVDVGLAATDAAKFVEPICRAKGVALRVDTTTGIIVNADPRRIKQIILNLLSNAAKFTSEGMVTVAVYGSDSFVKIRVSDTGIGIAEADVPHVFDPFWQADQKRTRREGGTGLGLSITKQLATMFGGTITLDSVLGKGSVFTVVLPVIGRRATDKQADDILMSA